MDIKTNTETLGELISDSYYEGFKAALAVLEGVLPELKKNPDSKEMAELIAKHLTP